MLEKPSLATSPDDSRHPFLFDRRIAERSPVEGAATILSLADNCFGRIQSLAGLDWSSTGLGGRTDTPIPPGTMVTVGFQSTGHLARRGVVVRCVPCGQGYRVGISFEGRLAA